MNMIHRRSGFTLIEVLASMAILSILILMLGSFFDQASKAWTSGERQVTTYSDGRGALDEMYRDSTVSVADQNLPFAVATGFMIDKTTTTPQVRRASPTPFKNNFAVEKADAVRMLSTIGARSVGNENTDLVDVTYWVEIGADKRGTLKRRGSSINSFVGGAPNNGVVEYVAPGGRLSSWTKLFGQPFYAVLDIDCETLLANVYSFEVKAYRSQNLTTPISNYYSKAPILEYLAPARVVYTVRLLSDQDWARLDTFSNLSEWHDFADIQADTFEVSAIIPMRGR